MIALLYILLYILLSLLYACYYIIILLLLYAVYIALFAYYYYLHIFAVYIALSSYHIIIVADMLYLSKKLVASVLFDVHCFSCYLHIQQSTSLNVVFLQYRGLVRLKFPSTTVIIAISCALPQLSINPWCCC